MVVSVDSPLEPLMTRTRAQINGGTAPDWEWAYTFYWCKNPGFTMGPGFGFSPAWDSIATVGDGFAFAMFYNCAGAAFNMNNVFNLPRNITAAGDNFAAIMFDSCLGATFNMNSGFNLPQGITIAGDLFAFSMFYNCSGAAFNMNSVFNLPQGITAAGDGFAADMFADCSGAAFLVNGVFTFPRPASFSLGTDAFKETFSLGTSTRTQSRSATSIINGNAAPTSDMNTFGPSGAWSDYGTIGANWQE
jgi:hypothetical protein